jgi:hypothetical protein
MNWISVKDRLPDWRDLVWIFVEYEDSPYDNVKEAVSLGRCHGGSIWKNILDPFMDDGKVIAWMPLEFPEKPKESELKWES